MIYQFFSLKLIYLFLFLIGKDIFILENHTITINTSLVLPFLYFSVFFLLFIFHKSPSDIILLEIPLNIRRDVCPKQKFKL